MKKTLLLWIFPILVITMSLPVIVKAQSTTKDNETVRDETAGKVLLERLQSKQVSCSDLSEDDFEKLGDYYMGQMMGSAHSAMDTLMNQRIGQDNNRLMHIGIGKRLSGCDSSASFPSSGIGFLPMMGMMGNWSSPSDYQPNNFNSMMGNFGNSMMGYGGFGFIPMIIWWVLIIAGIILLLRWVLSHSQTDSRNQEKTALNILKDRYAKGEIDKKEFEEKKKDLSI